MRVVVAGCGVSGLTSAVRLLEAGHEVEIRARELPPETTSNVAAAFWHPYRASQDDPVAEWCTESFSVFRTMADEAVGGVVMRPVWQLFREPEPDPWWSEIVTGFRHGEPPPDRIAQGYRDSFSFEAPVIDTGRFLPHLLDRVETAGGRIVPMTIHDLEAAGREFDLIVNCTGLGARRLTGDEELVAVRGEIVRTANPGLEHILVDEHAPGGLTYVIPRIDDCVLGGCYQEGVESLDPDPEIQAGIRQRCRELEPGLAGAGETGWAVGLRPVRARVRIEREVVGSGATVIHNYGHGGAGVTLSWGCASDVARLADGG